jgi:hypothetical protein
MLRYRRGDSPKKVQTHDRNLNSKIHPGQRPERSLRAPLTGARNRVVCGSVFAYLKSRNCVGRQFEYRIQNIQYNGGENSPLQTSTERNSVLVQRGVVD